MSMALFFYLISKVYIYFFVSSLHPGNLRSTGVGVLRAWSVIFFFFFGCQLSSLHCRSCNGCVYGILEFCFGARFEELAAFLDSAFSSFPSLFYEPSLLPANLLCSCLSICLHSSWWVLRQLCLFIFSQSLSFYLMSSPKLHAFMSWSRRVNFYSGILPGLDASWDELKSSNFMGAVRYDENGEALKKENNEE